MSSIDTISLSGRFSIISFRSAVILWLRSDYRKK